MGVIKMYRLLLGSACFIGRAFFPVLAVGAVIAAIVYATSDKTETVK